MFPNDNREKGTLPRTPELLRLLPFPPPAWRLLEAKRLDTAQLHRRHRRGGAPHARQHRHIPRRPRARDSPRCAAYPAPPSAQGSVTLYKKETLLGKTIFSGAATKKKGKKGQLSKRPPPQQGRQRLAEALLCKTAHQKNTKIHFPF